jgi:hypothetical protein
MQATNQQGNATCERIGDTLVNCHADPMQGCPHTARALSATGHLCVYRDQQLTRAD